MIGNNQSNLNQKQEPNLGIDFDCWDAYKTIECEKQIDSIQVLIKWMNR